MFRQKKHGEIAAELSDDETRLLKGLISEYLELLESDSTSDEPVLRRLYPSSTMDDPQTDAAYQELVHDELKQHKIRTGRLALQSLGPGGPLKGKLDPDTVEAWMVLLTDMRLSIGVRLGVTEDVETIAADPNDPAEAALAVFHYLGYLQETLVEACQA